MLDPISISALFVSSMQFVLQLKTFIQERKRKKQEEQQQQQQQLYPQASIASPSFTPITYSICYHIYQAYSSYYNHHVHYMQPAPLPLPLFQPPILYYQHGPAAPLSYSCSLPTHLEPSSSTHYDGRSLTRHSSTPSFDWLGLLEGRMELLHHQEAPHNTHETLGIRTGACAFNDRSSSYHHWKSLQEESNSQGKQRSIAVVDWSKGNIDMFMEIGGAYFRNYRISGCDVAVFAHVMKEREVFTGEIKEEKLVRCSKEMKMVEPRSGVLSTNSWMSLGIYEEGEDMREVLREQGSFIQTVRGAVFGLVCSLYEAPSHLNVDMETPHYISGHLDIVRINTHQLPCHLVKRNSCFFSVFSFGDHSRWAAQDILLG